MGIRVLASGGVNGIWLRASHELEQTLEARRSLGMTNTDPQSRHYSVQAGLAMTFLIEIPSVYR